MRAGRRRPFDIFIIFLFIQPRGGQLAMVLALLVLAAAVVAGGAPKKKVQPSFVIMLADDMGWGDWSRTGAPAATCSGTVGK